jgi:hypothetical protein
MHGERKRAEGLTGKQRGGVDPAPAEWSMDATYVFPALQKVN